MTGRTPDVKGAIDWIDNHPRTGWYTAVVVTLLLIDRIVQLFG